VQLIDGDIEGFHDGDGRAIQTISTCVNCLGSREPRLLCLELVDKSLQLRSSQLLCARIVATGGSKIVE